MEQMGAWKMQKCKKKLSYNMQVLNIIHCNFFAMLHILMAGVEHWYSMFPCNTSKVL